MTFRSSPMDERNDWMNSAMLEASGPASSTTPFFGCAVAISARVAAASCRRDRLETGRRHMDDVSPSYYYRARSHLETQRTASRAAPYKGPR